MTCSCMPDGATINGRPTCCRRITQPTLSVKGVLENDEHNPLVYHKSKPVSL